MSDANFIADHATIESKVQRAAVLNQRINERIASTKAMLIAELDELNELAASIKTDVCEMGQTVKAEGLTVQYVKESHSVTWNDDALMGLAVTMPEILKFRNAKPTKPTVRFIYAK